MELKHSPFCLENWLGQEGRWNQGYFWFAFGIFPLIGWDYTQITGLKTGVILCFSLLWLALLAVGLLAAARREKALPHLTVPSRLIAFSLGFWLLWSLLSAFFSPYGADVWLGQGRAGGWLGQAFFLCLLAAAGQGRVKPGLLRRALTLSVLFTAILCLWQLQGGNPLSLYPAGLNYYDGEVLYYGTYLGLIGNTGQLGAFLCLALPLLVWSWPFFKSRAVTDCKPGQSQRRAFKTGKTAGKQVSVERSSKQAQVSVSGAANSTSWVWLWTLLQALALGAGLSVVLWARLEAAWVGLAGGLLLTLLLLPRRAWLRLLLLGLLALAAGGALFLLWRQGGEPGSTLGQLARLLNGDWRGDYGSMRVGIWRGAWQLWQQRPWLGWGPDCFRSAWQGLFPAGAAPVDAAHNEYLGYAATCGWPALAAYLLAQVATLVRLARSRRWPLFCALSCYWLQAMFSFPTFIVAPLHWLLWGLALTKEP